LHTSKKKRKKGETQNSKDAENELEVKKINKKKINKKKNRRTSSSCVPTLVLQQKERGQNVQTVKKGLLEEYVPCIPLPGRWCQPPQLWHDQSMLLLHSSKTLLMITEFVTSAKKDTLLLLLLLHYKHRLWCRKKKCVFKPAKASKCG
jgi:hypothetical protein